MDSHLSQGEVKRKEPHPGVELGFNDDNRYTTNVRLVLLLQHLFHLPPTFDHISAIYLSVKHSKIGSRDIKICPCKNIHWNAQFWFVKNKYSVIKI